MQKPKFTATNGGKTCEAVRAGKILVVVTDFKLLKKNGRYCIGILFCGLLFAPLIDVFAQVKGKVRGGLDIGGMMWTSTAPSSKHKYFRLDPNVSLGYNLQNNMNVGAKIASGGNVQNKYETNIYSYFSSNSKNINFAGTYTYYLGSGTFPVIPFVGGGLGFYFISNSCNYMSSYEKFKKIGGFMTTGFEFGKFRMAAEYNLIPASEVTLIKYNLDDPNITPLGNEKFKIKNGYFRISVGFYIGGGNRKKTAVVAERAVLKLERAAELERKKAAEHEKSMQEAVNPISANAHDIIMLKNGQEINVKVTEITLSEIKYKLFEHLDGPTRTVAKKDVFVVIYENGTREVFDSTTENKRNTNTSLSAQQGDISIGTNLKYGIGGGYRQIGISAKFFYNITVPIRLEGSFTYFFPKNVKEKMLGMSIESKLNMWDASVNGHYLFPVAKRIALYPSIGIGMVGYKMDGKADAGIFGSKSESWSESWFTYSLGGGIDFSLSSNLVLNGELRYKQFGKDLFGGYRTNFSVGLAYRF